MSYRGTNQSSNTIQVWLGNRWAPLQNMTVQDSGADVAIANGVIGGWISIAAGQGHPGGSGGKAVLQGGDGFSGQLPGSAILRGGSSSSYSGSPGGDVEIVGGSTQDSTGGQVSITGGQAFVDPGNGGPVIITGGSPATSGTGGAVSLFGGSSGGSGNGGVVFLNGGSGPGGTAGASLTLNGGATGLAGNASLSGRVTTVQATATLTLNVAGSTGTAGQVLTANGSGGATWQTPSGSQTLQVVTAAGTTAITDTMDTLVWVQTASVVTLTMPTAALGKKVTVKASSVAGSLSTTVSAPGANIDASGTTTFPLTANYASASFVCVQTSPSVFWISL